jgi:hypothetical protein
MTNDELLAEARRRFPIGTKYYYVGGCGNEVSEITGDLKLLSNNQIYGVNWNKNDNPLINDCNVYENGKWATIIEEVKQDIDIILW